jgi:hypothetical protein
MSNETYSKKSQNQNPTKSQNSTESPQLCQISRTSDVLKGSFLQKRIKKNVNKCSYVLKIKKTFTPIPFTSRDVLKSPFLQKRIKKNVNKCYVLKIKKKPSPYPIYIYETEIKMAEMVEMVEMVEIISTWTLPKVEIAEIMFI